MSQEHRQKCLEVKSRECIVCGSTENIEVHHLDGDAENHDIGNLEPFCRDCHRSVHNADDGYEEWTEKINPDLGTKRFSLRLTAERRELLENAAAVISGNPDDDPPNSVVIDAALTHLIESKQNLDQAVNKHPPEVVKDCCDTSVLGLEYETQVESHWR